jgi:hypothetical protein
MGKRMSVLWLSGELFDCDYPILGKRDAANAVSRRLGASGTIADRR